VTKTILCYGDSITWGYNPNDGTRFSPKDRWPCILEQALDGRARVIDEALNGRTVATDDPSHPHRNGLAMLSPLLEAHAPLDIVLIMLGTNDSAPSYGLTPGRIAMNCSALIRTVRSTLPGIGFASPAIVLMAPPLLGALSAEMALFYAGGETTSKGLADAYRTTAEYFGCHFFDAGAAVQASATDGVHLDPQEQRKLALAVKDIVEPLL